MENAIQKLKNKLTLADIWDVELELNRWDYLKKANSVNTNLYFIEKGCVRVYFTEDAHEHSLYFGYRGSLISSLDSFISDQTSSLIIQCVNKTKVKVINKKSFLDFIQNDTEAFALWHDAILMISIWHLEREKDLLISSPLLRYQRTLSRRPLLFQEVPHKYIASYLRMTPETLSRILNS